MGGRGGESHIARVRSVAEDQDAPARSALAASWRRSLTLHGLDPDHRAPPETLTDAQLRAAREAIEPLISVAQGTLDRLYLAVGNTGCCVLLTNRDGVPVERRSAPADDTTFHLWGLWQGAMWSEAAEGTNGIGTCIVEGRALTIHRDQHFRARNTDLSCTVAPIHDHEGRLTAALDISSCRNDHAEGMLGLVAAAVADAARAIEAANFRRAFPEARIVVAPDADRGAALLAVDRHDLVVGATRAARLALGITDARIAGELPACDVLPLGSPVTEIALADAERGALRRALARANGNVSAAARLLGVSRATMHRKLARLGITGAH